MNSFELNKIFGAILGTLVLVMGVGFIAEEIYAPIENRGSTFNLPEPEGTGEEGGEQVAMVAPISIRMEEASAEAGEGVIVRCQSCHDYSESNENRVGPGLWGIVGRPIAAHEGFSYSDALVTLAETQEVWSYEALDGFVHDPQEYAPGTIMSFPGLDDPQTRADLIAFLREQADEPAPLPEVTEEDRAAMEGGTSAEGEGEAAEGEGGEEAADAGLDYASLIADADIDLGSSIAARCQGCHDFSEAMETRVGPALYGVVDRQIASLENYSYSEALSALGAEGEVWDFAHLDGFLRDPQEYAPGTTMGFAGLADEEERIALIAWIREQADEPVALESASEAVPAESDEAAADDAGTEEAAPAEDAAPADPEPAPAAEDEASEQAPATEASPAEEAAPIAEEAAPDAAPLEPVETPAETEAAPDATEADPAEAEAAEAEANETESADAPEGEALVADADIAAGESIAATCQGCHDFSEQLETRVGPGLHGVVDRPIASVDGFEYSEALSAIGADGEVWNVANLDVFLTDPQAFAPGTTMGYAGLPEETDRANLIAWLATLGAEADEADAEAATAEDEAPVIETEVPEEAAPNQPLTEVPGAGQTGGDIVEGSQPADDIVVEGVGQ